MKKTMKLAMASLLAIGLFLGCSGDANSSSSASVVKTESIKTLAFDATTGTVTENEIKAGDTGTTMVISEGTVLNDIDGNPIKKAPTLGVEAEKSETEAKTTIDFKVDGKKIIPTESVVFSVPAPAGSKAGDTVQIEVDDGIESTQKLILVIVKADGTVDIRIFPRVFRRKGLIVIVVKVKTDTSTN